MILSCSNVAKSFGERLVLSDISFQLESKDKLAIVGSNGCGKSTLLKIITGEMTADTGSVVISSDTMIGYLAQYQDDTADGSILSIVLSARPEILSMQRELRDMESEMGSVDPDQLHDLMNRYDLLSDRYDRSGGNSYDSEAVGILKGLGFFDYDLSKNMSELSGGQKTRVYLAKLLLKKPDILILDEPINHLDLAAIKWLEDYLAAYNSTVIIVAHDRYFLDRIANKVLDISTPASTHLYHGNYSAYYQQKEIRQLSLQNAYDKQQKEIEHQKAVIEKLQSYNREKSIKRAESRKKLLDKMERLEAPEQQSDRLNITFDVAKTSGKDVLFVRDLAKRYDAKELFSGISFSIYRGDRFAILGDNGIGKTTILKILNGVVPKDAGEITYGANVHVGYYDQEQQQLHDANTVLDELWDAYPDMTETKLRNVLAAFLFKEDEVFKSVSMLSGGERGKLALARLMLSGANFLILDEPTNHLDMDSKEVLEKALLEYPGTLLFVSHDRYFINRIADHIMEMTSGGAYLYEGNYDEYLAKKSTLAEHNLGVGSIGRATEENTDAKTEARDSWEKQKAIAREQKKRERDLEQTENEIDALEKQIDELNAAMLLPENAVNSAKLNELSQALTECEMQLTALMERWEALSV